MFIGTREVDAIIFDFDGTLADSMWVWNEVDLQFFAKRNIPFDREYVESFAVLGFEAGADFAVENFHLDERPEDIIAEWKAAALDSYSTQVMLKPGAREYLKYCKSCGTPWQSRRLCSATFSCPLSRTTRSLACSTRCASATSCTRAANPTRRCTWRRRDV